jgi:phosphoribosylformylglycinamidine synthase I
LKFGVVRFPGSCDEVDALLACRRFGDAELLWHKDRDLGDVDAVVVPGGFSYGDYLRAGAIARFSLLMERVIEFAREGGPVLGICNGFQVLCEAGLLPGALRPNESLSFVCRDVALRVERREIPFLARCEVGQRLTIPVKHGEGCWFAGEDLLAELDANEQIVLRYTAGENPNGAVDDVAGVRNAAGNVFGLMPHPEHAVDRLLGSTDGALILGSLVDAARLSSGALV